MKMLTIHKPLALRALPLVLALAAAGAQAEPSAADLGKTLTPVGAETKGNAAGTIPEWKGGDAVALAMLIGGLKDDSSNRTGVGDISKATAFGSFFANPYASDKPLFTISAANLAQHQAEVTPGHAALLKRYPSFRMPVYPTRRSGFFPQKVYDETAKNPGRAKLVNGGVAGTTGGVPFPLPKTGEEVVLNHKFRFQGNNYAQTVTRAIVSPGGEVNPQRVKLEVLYQYGNTELNATTRAPNIVNFYMEKKLAPARIAGEIDLAYSYATPVSGNSFQTIWVYSPGQRRVRLAPDLGYDTPQDDGLRTSDELDQFNGGTDRYDWKLVGKREVIVPYNNYDLLSPKIKYADLLKPGHLNPDYLRYELHRAWVVEATLKKGASHVYGKRVFYVDEDSWAIVVQEKYDTRGELWRVSEAIPVVSPWVGSIYTNNDIYYDLRSGRYLANGLVNEEKEVMTLPKHGPEYFSEQNLRALGTR